MVVVAALWLALLGSMLGRFAWPLDLLVHFRVQYAVLFLALAALLLFTKGNRLLIAAALVGALVSAVPIVPYVNFLDRPAMAASPVGFRLLTFNTWFRNHDYKRIAEFVEKSRADVVVLEELRSAHVPRLQSMLPSYPHAYTEPGMHGAVVLSRSPFLETQSVSLTEDGARAARVVIEWHGSRVTVLGAHLHWPLGAYNANLRNHELFGLAELARSQQGPVLVAGDFNVTPWSTHFRDALSLSGMQDAALGFGIGRSWPSQFPPLGIRIDHCLASTHWRSVAVNVGPRLGSDHLPLVADLELLR
jgi:endonuclease/exonuclease/phosphatase (EEP) superfamily protein YafD